MAPSPAPPDPGHCPLCGQPNQCAMEIERITGLAQPSCWCTAVQFDPSVLARVQAAARGKACLCHRCAVLDATSATNATATARP